MFSLLSKNELTSCEGQMYPSVSILRLQLEAFYCASTICYNSGTCLVLEYFLQIF